MRAAPPRPSGPKIHLDWVIVSIEGMRRWGLIVFFVVLASAVGGAAYYFLHEPIEKRAQGALRRATVAREEIHQSGLTEGLRGELDQASRVLDEAHSDWERKDYPACLARAEDALHRFELLSGLVNRDFVGSGQVIAVLGKVDVQRANQTSWERAREKQPLYNGDFIKTGSGASAEVLFADGTVYRIGPESLLEMHREARTGKDSPSVKVKVGQVNVYTALNPSSVVTDAARAEVDQDSRMGVEVADDSTTTVATYSGRARVTTVTGEKAELSELQAVAASPGGKLSGRRAVPNRPVLESPAANALVNLDAGENADRITLAWRPIPDAVGYELQVSRSRLFANLEFPANVRGTNSAVLRFLRPGTYHWRVAALGQDKLRSEWSDARALKAFSGSRVEVIGDTTPPRLDVQRPTQMGNLIIVLGTTEPGAALTVNGEAVEVGADGSFRKTIALNREGLNSIVVRATDPAGNPTEQRLQVFVEAD